MHESSPIDPNFLQQQIEAAIVRTVAYVDVFDYPLTLNEVHRYLVETAAPLATVQAILSNGRLIPHRLSQHQGYFALPGREELIAVRQRRAGVAQMMWPAALRYGRVIHTLPFVRMVAITGSLAVDNVEPEADVDYLIVTQPGRLWLCRALVILLVRVAARQGFQLCPNYFVSERSLLFQEQNLYAARELTQMVPIAGLSLYYQMRQLNSWTAAFLPNADDLPRQLNGSPKEPALSPGRRSLRAFAEFLLRSPAGGRLEKWEMERKIRKFSRRYGNQGDGVAAFGPDWCKGHFHDHGRWVLDAFSGRLRQLEEREA
ncbi:MAG: hypothetical protein AB1791_15430 [Chloroflexota bacterium]